ncbi:MAG: sulfatase [Cephaloticoccus sp.]
MNPPNILLILTDQLRADALGCYGGTQVPTPHLDALARQSTVYERCYVNNPICTPSRASLWTGKSILAHGVQNLHDVLPDTERLFPSHLQALGYATALFGKLHVSGRIVDSSVVHPHSGFDVYENALSPYNHDCNIHAYRDWLSRRDPEFLRRLGRQGSMIGHIPDELHFSTWVAERTAEFVTSRDPAKPFFCCASFVDPHDPFDDHPEEYLERVELGSMTRIERQAPAGRSAAVRREEAAGVLGSVDDYTDDEIMRMRRSYFASVGFLDTCVGRIMSALERAGAADDTLILFTSDHGEMLGQRRLLGKGAYFYEPCARVPLLMRAPGSAPLGRRSADLVQLHDIAATALHAAGMPASDLHAQMPSARQLQVQPGREFVYAAYRNSCINRQKSFWDPPINCTMVRSTTHKLTLYHADVVGAAEEGELYNMVADPAETRNLWDAPEASGVRANLVAQAAAWVERESQLGSDVKVRHIFPPIKSWLKNNPIRLQR